MLVARFVSRRKFGWQSAARSRSRQILTMTMFHPALRENTARRQPVPGTPSFMVPGWWVRYQSGAVFNFAVLHQCIPMVQLLFRDTHRHTRQAML